MPVETATKISQLDKTAPPGTDPKSEGDNHLRLIKTCLQAVFDDSGTTIKTTLPVESPGGAKVNGNIAITGNSTVGGDDAVTGNSTVGGSATVTGAVTAGNSVTVVGTSTPLLAFSDGTRKRGQVYDDEVNNKLMATVWNAGGTQLQNGEIFNTSNCPLNTGYQKFANGFLVNWGVVTANASGDGTITFPAAFTTGVGSVVATADTGAGIPANNAYVTSLAGVNNGGCVVQARGIGAGSVVAWGSGPIRWIAVGS